MLINIMKNNNSQKGFTFIELIIVFFVLIVGILGVYRFVDYPISQAPINEAKLTATYLAQEGVELVRNMRDTNFLKGGVLYSDGLINNPDCKEFSGGCRIDYNDDYDTVGLITVDPDILLQRDGNGFYNYSDGTQTKFQRIIIIEDETDYLGVKVEVTWEHKGQTQDPVIIEENIYPWWNN
tara:strand:- start:176 stop:718 length:543 start_codon:yes stop_codon:yes gene_type:complete